MLIAHQHQHPQVDLHLVTTAGPVPQAVFTKLGWSKVPVGQWDQASFWVTNYGGAVETYLQRRLPKSLSRALAAPFSLVDRFSYRCGSVCDVDWTADFDETFDDFWAELQESKPAIALASRSRNALKWHFRSFAERNDTGNEVWILTARRGSRLTGYAILQRKDSQSTGLTRMMLIDLQTLDQTVYPAMIAAALNRCRRENIHVLENLGRWIESLPIGARPPRHRTLQSWCYLYKATGRDLAKHLENPASWYPTQYDGDASL
jgi:hypothetical protein